MSELTAKRIRIIKANGPGPSGMTFAEWHDLCELALRGYVSSSTPAEVGTFIERPLIQEACANVGINFVTLRDEVRRLERHDMNADGGATGRRR